jgi:hypothetical protein
VKIVAVLKLIAESHGEPFAVRFVKRSNGEVREMTARTEVTKGLKGGERAYDFEEKGLVGVWDVMKEQYRVIPVEGITHFMPTLKDGWEEVEHPKKKKARKK